MTGVALLTDGQLTLLRRHARHWQPVASLAGEDVWLLVDAPDELLQTETLPPVGLFDRKALLARRLEGMEGIPWRAARLYGGWRREVRYVLSALREPAAALAAIETLAQQGATLAGVMSVSVALWLAMRAVGTPLIGLFLPGCFRLLVCRHGMPTLTRRLPLIDAQTLLGELRRTEVYLRRQRADDGPMSMTVLGQAPDGWQAALDEGWRASGGIVWQGGDALARLAAAPKGFNLAPDEYLRPWRARWLGRFALAGGALAVGLSLANSLAGLEELITLGNELELTRQRMAADRAEAARLEEHLRRSRLDPDLLRAAKTLDALWQASKAPVTDDLLRLSQALDGAATLRLARLTWRRADGQGCADAAGQASSPGTSPGMASEPRPGKPQLGARVHTRVIDFELRLPEDLAQRALIEEISRFDTRLRSWEEATVKQEPLSMLRQRPLKSNEKIGIPLRYCLEIANPDERADAH